MMSFGLQILCGKKACSVAVVPVAWVGGKAALPTVKQPPGTITVNHRILSFYHAFGLPLSITLKGRPHSRPGWKPEQQT